MIIAGRYRLLERIGSGSFGFLFKTEEIHTGEIVATKLEKREQESNGLLVREIKVLMEMKGVEGFVSSYERISTAILLRS